MTWTENSARPAPGEIIVELEPGSGDRWGIWPVVGLAALIAVAIGVAVGVLPR